MTNILQFIFNSIQSGCTHIIIGETHGSQSGLRALAEIASQLRYIKQQTGKNIVVLSESLPAISQTESVSFSTNTFNAYKGKKSFDWEDAEILHHHGIGVFGLENHQTNPALNCKTKEDIDAFLLELDEELYHNFIQRYVKDKPPLDFELYSLYAMVMYNNSIYRTTIPNEIFCQYITQIPDDTICIVSCGAAHIPAAFLESQIIDTGIESRLNDFGNAISAYITIFDRKSMDLYTPKNEGGLLYESIDHVIRPTDNNIAHVILKTLQENILKIQKSKHRNSSSNLKKLNALLLLDNLINQEIVYETSQYDTVNDLFDAWLEKNIRLNDKDYFVKDIIQKKSNRFFNKNNPIKNMVLNLRAEFGEMNLQDKIDLDQGLVYG
ncbi:hypothetical protein FOG18_04430 [Legionella israelensis]|uniref:hypothetical protein n=1 Tax=Legionella israelensis TaxID=454 RepID=UPI0011807407|nr:hypothetical protein [Legionella israelensis]QDP71873.1 hypothetical protein FOG18_04430 [Legionella israelensis]